MPIFGGIRAVILEYLLEIAEIVFVTSGHYFFRSTNRGLDVCGGKGGVSIINPGKGAIICWRISMKAMLRRDVAD
jgi:hypothetical protein